MTVMMGLTQRIEWMLKVEDFGLGSLAPVSSIDFQRHSINISSSLLDIYRKPHPGIIAEDPEHILPLNLNTKSHDFTCLVLAKTRFIVVSLSVDYFLKLIKG